MNCDSCGEEIDCATDEEKAQHKAYLDKWYEENVLNREREQYERLKAKFG
jgi:hypothetical protein